MSGLVCAARVICSGAFKVPVPQTLKALQAAGKVMVGYTKPEAHVCITRSFKVGAKENAANFRKLCEKIAEQHSTSSR